MIAAIEQRVRRSRRVAAILAVSTAVTAHAAAPLLDLFPVSVAEVAGDDCGETTITRDYTPSGSVWAEGLDETQVFLAQLAHRQGEDDSFSLRLGQGGQIYSLRGAFGESVPPSWRDPRNDRSPWNDEVWQFVAVCERYNGLKGLLKAGDVPDAVQERFRKGPFETSFFIHNSGAYIPGTAAVQNLSCPLLAFEADPDRRTIRTLNWGLVPQVRTVHRSPVLFYGQVRDVGGGIVELTWVVHNFSLRDDVVFDHLNAPWGGSRHTSLPVHAIASPDGEPRPREEFFPRDRPDAAIDVRRTGGWSIASARDADDAPSLAVVYGRDRHLEEETARAARGESHCQFAPSLVRNFLAHAPQLYERLWKDWRTRPENSFRNYDVVELIPKLRLRPQETIWYRSFLVVNRRDKAVTVARSLVDGIDYGLLAFDPVSTPFVPVHVANGRVFDPAAARGPPTFELYARPVPDSLPVFLLEDTTTGREVVSTDPYRFVPHEPLDLGVPADHPHHDYYAQARGISLDRHTTKWKRLLGYGLRVKPDGDGDRFKPVSSTVGPRLFPAADAHHVDVWVRAGADHPAHSGVTRDSLPPLKDGEAPTNLNELWGDYDPRAEPLETQVVREWEERGISLRHVVFTVGRFKGKPARLAGFYGFVNGGERVPGILQVHGGGQSASLDAVRDFARNGYACLSINWGGNAMEGVKDDEPNTDWGALDATQRHNDHYSGGKPDAKTLDDVESPRNNNWFLLVLAARRGLTFLERQPEVDPGRLGVTGHSMGGKITTNVAGIDRRVKAAVPSCGGAGGRTGKLSGMPGAGVGAEKPSVYDATIDDIAYIPGITCPILFMSPTNDFAGPFDNMTENWRKIGSRTVGFTVAPHLNHRALPETSICGVLWFDEHLKGGFRFPATPELTVSLGTASGVPRATVKPDRAADVAKVDLYYSIDPHCLTRFWRDAEPKRDGDAWTADLPVLGTDQPLFVYANVSYPLTTERLGFRGSKPPATFIISSRQAILLPEDLQKAGVKATDAASRLIDDFARGWHDWFRLEWGNPHHWTATTRKIKDRKWRGPDGAKLVFDVRCPEDNVLRVTVVANGWGAFPDKPWGGTYEARTPIKGSPNWQTVSVSLEDLVSTKKDDTSTLPSWASVTELTFGWSRTYLKDGEEVPFGSDDQQRNGWREPREFRKLRWEGGSDAAASGGPAAAAAPAPAELDATIQSEIKKSLGR